MKKNYYLAFVLVFISAAFGFGQVTIYSESVGTTGANGTTIAAHETNNAFDEVGLTYSGTGDIRNNAISSGYTGASGSRNVMLNNSGETFIIDGIDVSSYLGASVSFGIRKSTNASNGSGLIVEYSTTGAAGPYTTLTFPTLPTGGGTATWYYRKSSPMPNSITTIRFRSNNNVQWRLDDILVESLNTTLEFTSATSSLAEDGAFIDVCVAINTPSATVATTVDLELDTSSIAINGTDYDDGAGTPMPISFPLTLTFPANSNANQCFTVFISNDDLDLEGNETIVLNLINPSGGNSASLGTTAQHILTIVDNEAPVIADVILTEIMYNSAGTDDEWIEICNTSGSAQVLNDYTVRYNGSTVFTFPSTGAVIADGDCITVSLGSDSDGTYNNGNNVLGNCPFIPDYGIDASTNDTNNLSNNSGTISIVASDGSTLIDSVFYDDNDDNTTDGNGSSFHVIDDSLDNSNTDTNWQAVVDGGSPGTNSLVSPCSSLQPEINVEGDLGSFPNINNNDITPSFLDNTLFSDQTLGNSQTKSFRIQNIGTADLTVSNIQTIGGNAGDFTVTLPSALPIVIPQNGVVIFDVTFSPSVAGQRNTTIRINNDDPTGSENIFNFAIRGTGICNASANVLSPLTGPDNTIVTITGTNFGGSTNVEFGGSIVPHTLISATEIEITIPANSVSGNIDVTNNIGCVSTDLFTVIDNTISSCEGSGGTTPTELFISEVTDASTGGLTYIEIYNGTGATINLDDYSLRFYNNGSATQNGGSISLNNVNLADGDTYTVAVGVMGSPSSTNTCTAVSNSNGQAADQISGSGGINFDPNSDDHIRLYNNTNHIDSWGTYQSNTWADTLGIGEEGVVFTRNSSAAALPSTTFDILDWTPVNWNSCSENDYSGIGTFLFSTGVPPVVTTQPTAPIFDCTVFTASLTIAGNEGYTGIGDTQNLAYQWYFNIPGTANWTPILASNPNYTGEQSATLNILDTSTLNDYQYYCQLREDDASCFKASNATRLDVRRSIWNGTNWSEAPAIDRVAIIDGDYDTSVGGSQISFEACSCTVNNGNTLTIENNDFVRINGNLTVNGDVLIKTDGAFVQIDDTAIVDGNVLTTRSKIRVEKETSNIASGFEYTYWSSPVSGELINAGLNEANPNRVYLFNGQNFLDATRENNNDNTTITGQDDIDDDANDWQFVTGATVMSPGVGYAATHNDFGPFPSQFLYTFEGPFNNGVYNIPIYRNDSETNDNNWNFIGNPYPSAISADLFLAANTSIDQNAGAPTNGAIFFWSHNTAADGNTNGNENYNYAQSDYAIINGSGQTAGGDGVLPTRNIPSGQGFFVSMDNAATATGGTIKTTNVVFNNSMRVTGNNNQFFRNSNLNDSNRLWVNLTSDNGVSSQILVAYVNGATNDDDGMYYDAHRNLSADTNSIIYSIIEGNSKKFTIQGKAPNSLTTDEIIHVGFNTIIDEPTIYTISIYQFEGAFLNDNAIYLKDKFLNTIHNLKESDYTFTSNVGEFKNRFEIVFRADALSINDHYINANEVVITEHSNGNVEFKVDSKLTIEAIEIIDMLGRQVYNLKGNSNIEIYNLSKLSKAAYVAKIKLSNGQTISKKAIKQH